MSFARLALLLSLVLGLSPLASPPAADAASFHAFGPPRAGV